MLLLLALDALHLFACFQGKCVTVDFRTNYTGTPGTSDQQQCKGSFILARKRFAFHMGLYRMQFIVHIEQ